MQEVCWLSIDPVRRLVDFYPKNIAVRIENSYSKRQPYTHQPCVLGSDFFNATVHFHCSETYYQTTPGMVLGRAGFKQPGYRSVKRIIVPESKVIDVYTKQVDGECRIAATELESERKFTETIPDYVIISSLDTIQIPKVWKNSDLLIQGDNDNLEVISWQWCRGFSEKHSDLLKLSNNWWSPYPEDCNMEIEDGFKNYTESTLRIANKKINYIRDTCYAKQYDETNFKETLLRRVITRLSNVKKMLEFRENTPEDIDNIVAKLPPDSIPHDFLCVITQNIMKEPVSTVDNFTYEKEAIIKWFINHSTSPLTGLPLHTKTLVQNNTVYNKIQKFLEEYK